MSSYPCPHCGEPVPAKAKFCRECGSDASTGWSDEAEYGSLDLPEDMSDADYEAFLAQEFGSAPPPWKRHGLWGFAAIVVIVAFLLFIMR